MTSYCREGVQKLATALIKLTCKDWMQAKKALEKNPDNYKAKSDLTEIETFFISEWCYALTGMNGEYILKELEVMYGRGEIVKRH